MLNAQPPSLLFVRRLVLVLILATPLSQAVAQQSYFQLYDQTAGLNVGQIAALAQDEAGFVWVGAHRGLVRFDGHNFVAWAPDKVDELVSQIIVGPGNELLVRTASGKAWRRTVSDLLALIGPDSRPVQNLLAFDFDTRGNLWVVLHSGLWRRDNAQHWRRIRQGVPNEETPRFVRAVGDDVVVLTDQAAWRLRGDQPAEILLREPDLWSVAGDRQSPVWLVTHFGRLWRVDAAGAREIATPHSRVLDLRMRGSTLWLSLDTQLVGVEANGRQRHIGVADGLPSGGPLLVDRENSLWLGSFVGLVQFPEPDTRQWGLREGLPSMHAYRVVEAGGTVWVSTWGNGLTRIEESSGRLASAEPGLPDGDICTIDGQGIWAFDSRHVLSWSGTRFEPVADLPVPSRLRSCAADNAGNLWFATSVNLLRLEPGASRPVAIQLDRDPNIHLIWLDRNRLVVAGERDICRISLPTGNAAALQDCVSADLPHAWISRAGIAPRHDWITAPDGVFAFDGKSISRLHGNHQVEGGIIQALRPASDGDWWAAGAGVLLRIRPCADCQADWQVEEAPGIWQGLPGNAGLDVVQTAGGDLWIAGNRGVWRIPSNVRSLPKPVPSTVLVRAQVDADVRASGQDIELRPDDHRLELEFAALSFRDRSLLRYRSRIGDEGEWSPPTRDSRLQFAALEPGSYRAEMSASLDGEHWSAVPASVEFRVLPPWYRSAWARVLFALALFALLALIYRLRIAALLRVESERSRIAMDLHDEIGAGLGSIGMLAGAAARTRDDAEAQQRIVREIAEVSNFLGGGLRSLVWSLRSSKAGLHELGEQIADHARRLFPGDAPHLALRLPAQGPAPQLAAELRRHVLLLAFEALHNVARHAQAQQVRLSLEAFAENGFKLCIEDDGKGFVPAVEATGTGLESMRRRADTIHALLDIASSSRGTRVTLIYPRPRPA